MAVLMMRYLTEDGYGILNISIFDETKRGIGAMSDRGESLGDWQCTDRMLELVLLTINEFKRQLREVNFKAVIRANEQLDRLIAHRAALAESRRDTKL